VGPHSSYTVGSHRPHMYLPKLVNSQGGSNSITDQGVKKTQWYSLFLSS